MATTPNYAWTTPDDTNYVKNGAADIRTLANAIDATVKSNADAAVSATIVDAKGDLLAGTAADTIARLAVGTNGQILTANSSAATGLAWADPASAGDNWSLLNTGGTALTGANTITVSGISGIDKIMVLVVGGSSSSAGDSVSVRFNGDTSNTMRLVEVAFYANSTYAATNLDARNALTNRVFLGYTSNTAASKVNAYLKLTGGTSSGFKAFAHGGSGTPDGSNAHGAIWGGGIWENTATLSSVTVLTSFGNFDAGTLYVYGSA